MQPAALAFLVVATSSLLHAQLQTVATWRAVTAPGAPTPRTEARMVFDAGRNRVFLAGGVPLGGGNQLNQFFEWNGSTWTQIVPTTTLSLSSRPTRFCFDSAGSRILAVSGDPTGNGPPMLLYAWNGTTFTLLSSNGPPSRADGFEIVWDSSRNVMVMFGGGPTFSDTWEWNGTQWQQRGTGGPPGRSRHAMAYDSARSRTVLYGGVATNNVQLHDTWEWNGTFWQERFGIAAPAAFTRAPLVFDPVRGHTLLLGGEGQGSWRNEVEDYDGNSWATMTAFGGPPPFFGMAACYDTVRHRVVTFGGYDGNQSFGTYEIEIRTGIVASFGPHGAGCPGPAGVPSLQPRNGSRPVLGGTFQLRFGNLQNSPAALVYAAIGFSDQTSGGQALPLDLSSLGFTGCMLRIDPVLFDYVGNTGGVADWNVAVPADPALDGIVFFAQGLVAAPLFNPGSAVVSDSGRGVAGAL